MMADVPKADVIVTNPTHYSVALRYDGTKVDAPEVVAKGKGHIALRIREIAREHGATVTAGTGAMRRPPRGVGR